jgi:sporulation protein YlmC with PRC-barrel domain
METTSHTKTHEKMSAHELMGKTVVSKTGKKFGEVEDILFETQNGELMNIVLKNPTRYIDGLGLERNKDGDILIPFHSVIAMGDFLVINEEDIF